MSYAVTGALQAAVYQVLVTDPALTDLIGGAVHDALPDPGRGGQGGCLPGGRAGADTGFRIGLLHARRRHLGSPNARGRPPAGSIQILKWPRLSGAGRRRGSL